MYFRDMTNKISIYIDIHGQRYLENISFIINKKRNIELVGKSHDK